MKFSEQEIQTARQSAIDYFNTTFGLDFSQSEPNQQGQRIFQNASFAAGQAPFTATTKANRWLVTGSTRSRCFDVRLGWFGISFLGQQVLHGTYGGTEGRIINGPSQNTWLQIDQIDGLVFILVITDSPATYNLMFKCTAILRIKLN